MNLSNMNLTSFDCTEIMYILQGKLLYYIPLGWRIMLKLRTFGKENYCITYFWRGKLCQNYILKYKTMIFIAYSFVTPGILKFDF